MLSIHFIVFLCCLILALFPHVKNTNSSRIVSYVFSQHIVLTCIVAVDKTYPNSDSFYFLNTGTQETEAIYVNRNS